MDSASGGGSAMTSLVNPEQPNSIFIIEISNDDSPGVFTCGPYRSFLDAAQTCLDLLPELLAVNGISITGPVTTRVLECLVNAENIEVIDVRAVNRELHNR